MYRGNELICLRLIRREQNPDLCQTGSIFEFFDEGRYLCAMSRNELRILNRLQRRQSAIALNHEVFVFALNSNGYVVREISDGADSPDER